jgi:EAL domain-containing protein (putative c-di-GMP-specific phosphodiesterase class I)
MQGFLLSPPLRFAQALEFLSSSER